ncbi:hypothetical protein R6Q59_032837 [Mikania micrantha]
MAQELADGEFWLPPEFLNDEDILTDFHHGKPNSGSLPGGLNKGSSGFHGFGLFGSNSDVSSPVESESDEEEYLHGLTQKLANSTLNGDLWSFDSTLKFENNPPKSSRVMSSSPQSTLCGCKNGSSRGSPNCVSPPATAADAKKGQPSWELLYAAAGEVARMRMIEEAASRYHNSNKNPLAVNPKLHYQQLQVAQFQQLKQQQIAKQQYLQMMLQNRARNECRSGRPVAPAWPTPQPAQQQPPQRPLGSGMRAVFLGNPSTKRESTGTGVFLPRQPGAPTEPLKKRGCSTVLLPDRVVQALDLKLEAMGGESKLQSRCNGGSLASDFEAEMIYRKSVMIAQQRRANHRSQPATLNEFRLPQEWTY